MDRQEIAQTLRVLTKNEPDAVAEIRLLPKNKKDGIGSGYFDPPAFERAAQLLQPYVEQGKHNFYVTMSRLHPGLLARYNRRFQPWPLQTTTDSEVTAYRWILMDFDPVRPSGINTTDEEMEEAMSLARSVQAFCMEELEMDAPVEALSGNGVHLLFPVDLPANAASTKFVKDLLEMLAKRFNTERCKLDTANFNPARITKLYGTIGGKGDGNSERPNRQSRITVIPAVLGGTL